MEYSLGLALLDFVPIFAFLVGAYFLVRAALITRGKPCGRMMMAGTLLVFAGGFFKAIWKMLYVTGVADIQVMSEMQFVLHAPGFLAMFVAILLLAKALKAAPSGVEAAAIAVWKIPLLAVMTVSSLGAQGILASIAFRKKSPIAGGMFIAAIICMLTMSGMASGSEQTVAMQWIEEVINTIGQVAFAFGSFLIYRTILKEQQLAEAV